VFVCVCVCVCVIVGDEWIDKTVQAWHWFWKNLSTTMMQELEVHA